MLTIRDGKIYDTVSRQSVAPEIGNAEHIAVLKKHNEQLELLKREGIPARPEFKIEATVSFMCICGRKVEHEEDVYNDDADELNLSTCKCYHCKREYTMHSSTEFEILITLDE